MRSQSAAFAFEGAPSRDASRRFLEQAVAGRGSRGSQLIVTVPAPVARPDALLRAFPREASILWDPPQSAGCSGLGVATTLAPDAQSIGEFFDRTEHLSHEASLAPRVFGGASFAPGAAQHTPWQGFGDGFLLLPTWTYQVQERASLSFAICEPESPSAREVLEVFDAIWDTLERPIGVIPAPVSVRRIDESDRETWSRQVDEIRQEIAKGSVDKIVAARHCVVELETGAGSLDVLKRLEGRFPGCTRFAMWRGDAAFLGATPELLISRRGPSVLSEA